MTDGEPSYLALQRSGALAERAARALALLDGRCLVCPRLCKVDRLADTPGLCKVGRRAVVASYFPHFGEENCLRGWRGRSSSAAATCAACSARTTRSPGSCRASGSLPLGWRR